MKPIKTEVIADTGVSGYFSLFGIKQNQWKYSNMLQNGFYTSDLFRRLQILTMVLLISDAITGKNAP